MSMTNIPEPGSFPTGAPVVPWWWQCTDSDGRVVEPAEGRQDFPTRSDAESWVGEFWAELADQGISAVTLFEGERQVYGPMSLEA
jgi:hypothetical protein